MSVLHKARVEEAYFRDESVIGTTFAKVPDLCEDGYVVACLLAGEPSQCFLHAGVIGSVYYRGSPRQAVYRAIVHLFRLIVDVCALQDRAEVL